jgi:hypothetical protein
VSTSIMKWSEGLGNRVSIIRRRCENHIKFAAYMAISLYHILSYTFGSILYECIYGCMLRRLLFKFC